jgi:hypothetical protein
MSKNLYIIKFYEKLNNWTRSFKHKKVVIEII